MKWSCISYNEIVRMCVTALNVVRNEIECVTAEQGESPQDMWVDEPRRIVEDACVVRGMAVISYRLGSVVYVSDNPGEPAPDLRLDWYSDCGVRNHAGIQCQSYSEPCEDVCDYDIDR